MASMYDLKIFRLNRIRFQELWDDATNWIRRTYNQTQEQFTIASPFAQLLYVILHMGRMIFYYIEDSITGLNIRTAYRPDQIRGLMRLAGHNSSRPISARAGIRIIANETGNQDYKGQVCFIPNKTTVKSKVNGASYILLFNSDTAKITMSAGNYVDGNIIQGKIQYQRATGTGMPLQSYNFNERNYSEIEEYFINIYVNGERWDIVESILDLGYEQKGVVVKTGQTGGIDIFFGNHDMGAVPAVGATILCEYIVTDGLVGNISKDFVDGMGNDAWEISGTGYLQNGTTISLNENFTIKLKTSLIFGAPSEDITLTQAIAPHVSRSMVLANETNYKYFFKKMNMFSHIEIIKGYATKEVNVAARINADRVEQEYNRLWEEWRNEVSRTGEDSAASIELYQKVSNAADALVTAKQNVEDTTMSDNTVYIMLIPDISKRISAGSNYFTCSEKLFTLSDEEQYNILQMIENSGQKIITMEHRMVAPKIVKFALNVDMKIWEGYNKQSVYTDSLRKLSDYFIAQHRKDIIPVSDIVAILEGVEGVDSVRVWFDADVNNQDIYGKRGFYGIDEYGDIVLSRTYVTSAGIQKKVRDMLPLIRGGFTSPHGVEYSDVQSIDYNSAFNINITAFTHNTKLTMENPID